MLCHDGIVSLVGFLGNFVLAVLTSILVIFYLEIELNSPDNAFICITGSIGIFLIGCALCYFVLSKNDFEVILIIIWLLTIASNDLTLK